VSETRKAWMISLMFFIGLIISAIQPKNYFIWMLEVFPAIMAYILLILTRKYFRFTGLVYILVLLHCYILFIGGHYTYAEVPLFSWIRDAFGHQRNNYDKIGHLAQGFVPALFVREILVRHQVVAKSAWLPGLVVCICVTVSVLYEFIEWFVAIATGTAAEAFLSTQGDIWDTQSDMLMALIGATVAMLTMVMWQDRQIEALLDSGSEA
jgi:putative membrane protein